ncbi:hypothetical protein PVAND_001418 [Polypedilum vanderplanki]|uniref:Circadian clock-controlled protein n=1 Tax=Polypedilum vanderplanki TaxID=319348 RepID=A0A9J6BMW6_POLVA|nr:hypothetical protein PVAND_001418 [Polypedilum vanderplanki]
MERCKVHDETCILRVANDVLWNSYEGNSSFGLSSIDPFNADEMKVVQDVGIVEIEAVIKNFSISGFSKGKFLMFRGFKENLLQIRLKTEAGIFKGPYKVKGKVLLIPVTGEGTTLTTFHNLDLIMKLPLTNYTRDNKTFLKIVNPKMTFELSGGETHLSHLSSFANQFINWSFDIVINAVKDAVSVPLVQIFAVKINEVFDQIPYEEMFIN